MKRVIYVGGPYTHADHNIRRERFEALTAIAAEIVKQGHIVYSPITHTHPIDLHFVRDDVHLSSDFWCDFDETFMSVCTEMVIVPLEGWEKSGGVKREREYFEARGAIAAGTQSAETSETSAPSEGCQSGPKGIAPNTPPNHPRST
jgi:hypothetical protein